ncbi:aminotransferase class I/II-fold pyridoxal phosphate-dependent enzyme [Geobacter sulfurreducens]|uniref:dTDP-4-dehydro-6-deoxyglucose aminotransferase n=2 Tax=Geobacter sulfurreducens TaxID=35554 RepID=Q748I1_GEOSL|nr:dTDP-4-dehydro-6-deoxyglucose aminotransferase [Geobacter sulfurreducens PCA]UAC05865.1 aminotransferase class I/II-fold pyridoxal phosphate-dependent enzyme [Geobacter sulfurreducens]HBB70430.1 dTDP-4-dehydro-6-deoxyglucose aminotransferase [Geobacter sulfurreducens]HCD95285.1 dTDP-4-dehydro-6-deoxyglucose aminotransferase [Geobacter sulfurreducens]
MNPNASFDNMTESSAPPSFKEKLHVGRPNVGNREALLARINDMLDRRWLTNNGPFVQELEQKMSEFLGVRNCIAMCNATIALEITTRALGMSGEVIVPPFTFVATAHALQWQEITPVFCDIDPTTHHIDPKKIESMITPRTTGIVGVHLWGRPCAVNTLTEIAAKHKLKLIFDAAHAFGCSHGGRMIGGFGDAEVFSFHATKFFNTFEGGLVATDNDELAQKIRLMKNFGFEGYDNVIYIGTNGKMTEICAAMGLTNLESLDEFIQTNHTNYYRYRQGLSGLPGVSVIEYNEAERNNYQYVVLEIDEKMAGVSRDRLVEALHAKNVIARRYFYPGCHRMEPYRSYFPHSRLLLPKTERLARRVMLLPTGTAVELEHIDAICVLIKRIINGSILS